MSPNLTRNFFSKPVRSCWQAAVLKGALCLLWGLSGALRAEMTQPCQGPPDAMATLTVARALYTQARFAEAAAAFAGVSGRAGHAIDERLEAMNGWERALKAQACDADAMEVQRKRLELAQSVGNDAARRMSLARLARLARTGDSAEAERLAMLALDGAASTGDDSAADAHTTLAMLAIDRDERAKARSALSAAFAAATSPLRRSEAWRTEGVLRQADGRYGAPEAAFQRALDEAREAADPEAVALAEIYKASTLPAGQEHAALLQSVRSDAQHSNMRRVEAIADRKEAELSDDASFDERRHATDLLESAARRLVEIEDKAQERYVQLQLANRYYQLGDLATSRKAVERGLALAQALRLPSEVAKAEQHLAILAQEQQPPDWRGAGQHLQNARAGLCGTEDLAGCARVMNELAIVARADGETTEALDWLIKAQALATDSREVGAARLRQQLLVSLGWTLLGDGRIDEAKAPLWAVTAAAEPVSETQGHAWWGLARVYAEPAPEIALMYFERALAAIDPLRPRGRSLSREVRQAFDQRYSSLYRELAALLLRLNRTARAHYVASLMQRMELIESDWQATRSNSALPEGLGVPTKPEACELDLAARQNNYLKLRREVEAAATAALKQCCEEASDARTCPEPRTEARLFCAKNLQASTERTALKEADSACIDLLRTRPKDTKFFTTDEFDTQWTHAVSPYTKQRVTLVVTVLEQDRLHVLVRGPATGGYLRYSYSIRQNEIENLLDQWRIAREQAGSATDQHLKKLRSGLLHEMYQLLFRDVPLWVLAPPGGSGKPFLVLALDGPLRALPLAALYDGEGYLGERVALALLTPGALAGGAALPAPSERSLVLGMSKLAVPMLKYTVQEVGDVAQRLHVTPYLDQDATVGKVTGWLKSLSEPAAVLHIAAHGDIGGTLSSTAIHLADADDLNGNRMADQEISEQLGKVQLVVLSSCESAGPGQGQLALGLAGIVGLGARTVIGSLWRVNDPATADLMAIFYQEWMDAQRISVSESLSVAQQKIRKKYPHPYFWAAFIPVGRWD